ncbi:MAG: DUF411 domain-containing protein [Pararhodobacter sp.]|nr:DUF411 domain-containing protein [Pararhodobacter sp.]
MKPSRRHLLATGLAALGASALPGALPAASRLRVDVWWHPGCGCCSHWMDHLRAEGFDIASHPVEEVGRHRRELGTPSNLLSCHAAQVDGGLVLEGHVPALAIRRALEDAAPGLRGLAVPAMPIGSPGMEIEGMAPETYDVIAWAEDGRQWVFLTMQGGIPA